ncbi:helix-turn-helix domain-containing protein [Streptomyces sp. NPDC091040]|uniref:helix-turn-helix domain-containing protein n=1 Tax=Streptomyces sp. NPDC091040 TaxID=3365972 RepID=UPI00381BD36C
MGRVGRSEESERLAKALVELREAEGLSVGDLARRTRLSRATIRLHESDRGDVPLPFAASRFEEVLGWAPGSLPTTESEPPPGSVTTGG